MHVKVQGRGLKAPLSDEVWIDILPWYRLVGVTVLCKYAGSTFYVNDGPLWIGKAGENDESFYINSKVG